MQRIHLKRRKPMNRLLVLGFVIFFAFLVSLLGVYYTSKYLTPTLMDLAEAKLNKYSILLVNNAISQVLEDKINEDELFSLTKSSSGEIQLIDFNPVAVNQILNVATTVVQNHIHLLEEGDLTSIGLNDFNLSEEELTSLTEGIVASLPIGRVTNITFLSNLGPKIPVRFHYVGDVNSNISTKLTQYGINNALIEIGVRMELSAQIYLPFTTSVKVLDCTIPIVIKMVQGTVPNFYSGSLLQNSNLYSREIE